MVKFTSLQPKYQIKLSSKKLYKKEKKNRNQNLKLFSKSFEFKYSKYLNRRKQKSEPTPQSDPIHIGL